MKRPSSKKPLLAYYADDFTGSTDALESLARAGLKTILFLTPPTSTQLAKFPNLQAFGIVGGSRVMDPAQMTRELSHAFKTLKRSGASIVHYKTCSTFDSSPSIGSVGRAIEIGRKVFGRQLTPLVVAFPAFGRHVVFGNLFARSGESEIFRLDRHPMSQHPVTPMDEADLRLHLSKQTRLPIDLVDILAIKACGSAERSQSIKSLRTIERRLDSTSREKTPPIMLFDTLDADDLPVIGRLIASQRRPGRQLFCAGSSGVGYAVTAYWKMRGVVRSPSNAPTSPLNKGQMIVISGSCSPVTGRQIDRALQAGFVEIRCDTGLLADARRARGAINATIANALPALLARRNIIFHTARGISDSRRRDFECAVRLAGGRNGQNRLAATRAVLGDSLGKILKIAQEKTGARRLVMCGGDTATQAGRTLGIVALEYLAPASIGAPWCTIHAPGLGVDGCELICKGGQVGNDDFLVRLAR